MLKIFSKRHQLLKKTYTFKKKKKQTQANYDISRKNKDNRFYIDHYIHCQS